MTAALIAATIALLLTLAWCAWPHVEYRLIIWRHRRVWRDPDSGTTGLYLRGVDRDR